MMNPSWTALELAESWALTAEERVALLSGKMDANRLSIAALLKFFQLEGRFPANELATRVIRATMMQPGITAARLWRVENGAAEIWAAEGEGLEPERPLAPALQHHDAQLGREARRLSRPVMHDRGRANHERWPALGILLAQPCDPRQRLQRLAEPHVVGEHAPDAILAKVLKPGDALDLIRTQDVPQSRREGQRLDRGAIDDRPGALDASRTAPPFDRSLSADDGVERGEAERALHTKPRFCFEGRRAVVQIDEDFEQGDEPIGVEREVAPLPDRNRSVAGGHTLQRGEWGVVRSTLQDFEERRQEIHPLTVDLDPELEAEPVTPLLFGERGVPGGAGRRDSIGVLFVQLDDEPLLAKPRHGVRGERTQRVDVRIDVDQIVRERVGTRHEVFQARELHDPERLEQRGRPRFAGPVATDSERNRERRVAADCEPVLVTDIVRVGDLRRASTEQGAPAVVEDHRQHGHVDVVKLGPKEVAAVYGQALYIKSNTRDERPKCGIFSS